jgi:beta-galactosidase
VGRIKSALAVSLAVLLFQAAPAAGVRPSAPGAKAKPAPSPGREVILLDDNWRFALGQAADPAKDFGFGTSASYANATSWRGAPQVRFNDSGWRPVDLPHDWAIELPFVNAPLSETLLDHGFKPLGRGFPETSIGWYRKRFTIPKEDDGRRIRIDFDGAFRDCHVWLNGILLGRHEGGYSPFGFDATDFIVYGGENVLVVRVDATQAEGWFYEGAGIYRHVRMTKTAPVHIPRYGTNVTAEVKGNNALVSVQTEVLNASDRDARVTLRSLVLDPAEKIAAEAADAGRTIGPWQTATVQQTLTLANPALWSLERPALYKLRSIVLRDYAPVDQAETRFGVRTIRFDKDRGFFLNDKHIPIQGVCCHQDHAGVGAALPDRLQYFRIGKLKEMGVNAYRTSHNPPAPEILDACDELGMLVMDEQRLFNSNDIALDQLRGLVKRDRNHPSIILWSIGNEEGEQGTPRGRRIAETMVRTVKALDLTRPVTYASNSGFYEGINQVVDVRGFNYHMDVIDKYRLDHPDQPLYGSEIASTVSTRGEYLNNKERGYVSSYDANKPPWGELAREWMMFYAARPWLAGAFVWTGFDYRGEPTPYGWPCINSHFGLLDTCGFPKDLFWYYKSWWTDEPVLHLLPHWNWSGKAGQPVSVWAFTNLDEVKLTLNGRDLGTQQVSRFDHAEWKVIFQPGTLEAVGFKNGVRIVRTVLETTGEPSRVTLSADRATIGADGRDVSVVTVGAVDAQGRPVPDAAVEIGFEISGPGRILGVGNGDPSSHEPDVFLPAPAGAGSEMKPPQWHRKLFNGLAQVIVQSRPEAGTIVLTASAPGLQPATLAITTAAKK